MKNHGGYGGHGDYSFETEKGLLPNPIDIIAGVTQIPIYLYHGAKKIAEAPINGLIKIIKGIGGFEENDID